MNKNKMMNMITRIRIIMHSTTPVIAALLGEKIVGPIQFEVVN